MRIVRHPNIVELKAFYYSNGERVSNPPKQVLVFQKRIGKLTRSE